MTFEPGSIIKRPIEGFWGWLYDHMGIYIGNNQVVHFSGESKKERDVLIHKVCLAEFAAGHKVQLHAAPKNRMHAIAICKKADQIYKNRNNSYNGRYHFTWNNCEDFCIECYEEVY